MSGSSGSTESVPEADGPPDGLPVGLPDGLKDGDQMEVTHAAAVLPQPGLQVITELRNRAQALSSLVCSLSKHLPGWLCLVDCV